MTDSIKKFRSAYIIFSLERRPQLRSSDPCLTNQNTTKAIAEEWRSMPEAKKEVYYKQEEQGREQFLKRKQQLNAEYKYKTNPRNKVPLRFRTPYMFFIKKHKDQLNSHSKLENINNIKKLTEMWHKMSNEEKSEYVKMRDEDKKRYDREVEQYMMTCMKFKEKKIKKKEKIDRFLKQFLESKILTGDEGALDNFKFEEEAKLEKVKRKSLRKLKKDNLIFNVCKKQTNKKKRVANINEESVNDDESQGQCLSLSQCPSHEISLNPHRHNSNIFKELNYQNRNKIENNSIDDEEESNPDFFDLEEENQYMDMDKILEDKLKDQGEKEDPLTEEVSMDLKQEEDSEMDDINIDDLNEEELNELLKYKLLKMNTGMAKTIANSNKHSQAKPATIKQILKKTK